LVEFRKGEVGEGSREGDCILIEGDAIRRGGVVVYGLIQCPFKVGESEGEEPSRQARVGSEDIVSEKRRKGLLQEIRFELSWVIATILTINMSEKGRVSGK
jgi:hypothetical protein